MDAVVAICLIVAGLALLYSREFAARVAGLALFCGGGAHLVAAFPVIATVLAILIVGLVIGMLFFGKRWLPWLRPMAFFKRKPVKKAKKRRKPKPRLVPPADLT